MHALVCFLNTVVEFKGISFWVAFRVAALPGYLGWQCLLFHSGMEFHSGICVCVGCGILLYGPTLYALRLNKVSLHSPDVGVPIAKTSLRAHTHSRMEFHSGIEFHSGMDRWLSLDTGVQVPTLLWRGRPAGGRACTFASADGR